MVIELRYDQQRLTTNLDRTGVVEAFVERLHENPPGGNKIELITGTM